MYHHARAAQGWVSVVREPGLLPERNPQQPVDRGSGHNHPMLLCSTLQAGQLSWTLDTPPQPGCYCAKTVIGSRMPHVNWMHRMAAGSMSGRMSCNGRLASGQSVVLYDGEICLG